MSHGKHGFRAFGSILLGAVGLMVFMAGGAQANWLYLDGGKSIELTANELVKISKATEHITLLIEGVNIQFLCNKVEGEDVLLEPGNATTANATGKALFSECVGIEKSSEKEVKNCDPINQQIKASYRSYLILHTDGLSYFLVEGNKGSPFATVEVSELCALTETAKVTGSVVLECGQFIGGVWVQEDCAKHKMEIVARRAPAALFPKDALKYGAHVATIDGAVGAELAGTHAGDAWSGVV